MDSLGGRGPQDTGSQDQQVGRGSIFSRGSVVGRGSVFNRISVGSLFKRTSNTNLDDRVSDSAKALKGMAKKELGRSGDKSEIIARTEALQGGLKRVDRDLAIAKNIPSEITEQMKSLQTNFIDIVDYLKAAPVINEGQKKDLEGLLEKANSSLLEVMRQLEFINASSTLKAKLGEEDESGFIGKAETLRNNLESMSSDLRNSEDVPIEIKKQMQDIQSYFIGIVSSLPEIEGQREKLVALLEKANNTFSEVAYTKEIKSLEKDWNAIKTQFDELQMELGAIHPKLFTNDMRGERVEVLGKTIDRSLEFGDSRDNVVQANKVGAEIFETLESKLGDKEGFDKKTLHLLRYQLESMFNQWLAGFGDTKFLSDNIEKYGMPPIPVDQPSPKIELDGDKIRISIEKTWNISSSADPGVVIETNVSKIEMEIDLNKIDPQKLLKTPGCATLKRTETKVDIDQK